MIKGVVEATRRDAIEIAWLNQVMRSARNLSWVVIVAFAVSMQINAQSGRIKKIEPTPSPATSVSSTPTSSTSASSTAAPVNSGEKPIRTTFHPAAFIITGKTITEGYKSYGSDDVRDVADEIKFMFDLQRMPARIVKGGKMTREQAVARAKQQTDSYVLWMEIHEKIEVVNLRVITKVDHIDYLLLMPGTGEVVRQFSVDPRKIVQTNEHGTPLPPRTQGRSQDSDVQLRHCAWEMARVLVYWL